MNDNYIERKSWLDYLFYKENKQRDFFVCGTYGERKFTKWKTYLNAVAIIDVLNLANNDWKELSFFKQINQRQILPHEIVLDIEDPKQLKPIVKKLKEWSWKYSIWSTKSRGYHIHILCDKKLEEGEKLAVVEKLGTDVQKCSEKNLIALENEEHWKGKGIKTKINKRNV